MNGKPKVLVLGASGMLGNVVFRYLCQSPSYRVMGTVRSSRALQLLPQDLRDRITCVPDVENLDYLVQLFARVRPDVVINCIGLVKQSAMSKNPVAALLVNAVLPHRLHELCKMTAARLVHVSTDCVFSGAKGMYRESDVPDAIDLYGRSKLLGEIDSAAAVTLRTSIVGPELDSQHGLLNWLLSQQGSVGGYTRAIFSGLPTVELARVMRDFVLPTQSLQGVFHVTSEPISKHDLLLLFARVFRHPISIEPDSSVTINRSLDGSRFREATGYAAPAWPELVQTMRQFG